MIDDALSDISRSVAEIEDLVDSLPEAHSETLRAALIKVIDRLCKVPDKLEDLRDANSALRAWGTGVDRDLLAAQNELTKAQKQIDLLEGDLQEAGEKD